MTKWIAFPAAALLGAALVRRPADVPAARPAQARTTHREAAPFLEVDTFRILRDDVASSPISIGRSEEAEGEALDRDLLLARATAAYERQRYEVVADLCELLLRTHGDLPQAASMLKDARIVFAYRRLWEERIRAIPPAATPFEAVMEAARVDLDVQNWPLSAIVDDLRTRTGLDLRMRHEVEGYISFKAEQMSLRQALTLLLHPRNLVYEIDGVTIWIGSADRNPDRY